MAVPTSPSYGQRVGIRKASGIESSFSSPLVSGRVLSVFPARKADCVFSPATWTAMGTWIWSSRALGRLPQSASGSTTAMASSLEVTQLPIHVLSGPKAPRSCRILRRRHSKQLFLSPTDLALISPTSPISATTCSSSHFLYSRAPPALKRAPQVGRRREPRLVCSLNDQAGCRTLTRPSGLMAQRVCLPAGAALGPSRALPQRSRVFSGASRRPALAFCSSLDSNCSRCPTDHGLARAWLSTKQHASNETMRSCRRWRMAAAQLRCTG